MTPTRLVFAAVFLAAKIIILFTIGRKGMDTFLAIFGKLMTHLLALAGLPAKAAHDLGMTVGAWSLFFLMLIVSAFGLAMFLEKVLASLKSGKLPWLIFWGVVWFVANAAPSLFLGAHMHTVLVGPLTIGPGYWPAFAPKEITVSVMMWAVVYPVLFYTLWEVVLLVSRPPSSIPPVVVSWATSIWPLAEVGYAVAVWVGGWANGKPAYNSFQEYAITVWLLTSIIELLLFIVSLILVRRNIQVEKAATIT